MVSMKNNRLKEINDMVSIVKLASLLFTGIIFFQYFFDEKKINGSAAYAQSASTGIMIAVLILLFIYILWSFPSIKRMNKKSYEYIMFVENLFFIAIFFIAVIFSGANESQYKYIFLFMIIN